MLEAGLSQADFWALSPRDLYWLSRQLELREERENRRTALLCAVIANGLLKRQDGRPFEIDDFMPQRPRRERVDPDTLAAKARAITWLLGGEVRG